MGRGGWGGGRLDAPVTAAPPASGTEPPRRAGPLPPGGERRLPAAAGLSRGGSPPPGSCPPPCGRWARPWAAGRGRDRSSGLAAPKTSVRARCPQREEVWAGAWQTTPPLPGARRARRTGVAVLRRSSQSQRFNISPCVNI